MSRQQSGPTLCQVNKVDEVVAYIGCMDAGNHEYDYRTGKEKHKSHNKDPSGASSPYEPDWGNYGIYSLDLNNNHVPALRSALPCYKTA